MLVCIRVDFEFDIVLLAASSDEFGRHVHRKLTSMFDKYRPFRVYYCDDDSSESVRCTDFGKGQLFEFE